jgi:hypothetical protein
MPQGSKFTLPCVSGFFFLRGGEETRKKKVDFSECDAREVMIRYLRRPVFFVQTMEKDRVPEQRDAHRHAAGDNPTVRISF